MGNPGRCERLIAPSTGHFCNKGTFAKFTETKCVQSILVYLIQRWVALPQKVNYLIFTTNCDLLYQRFRRSIPLFCVKNVNLTLCSTYSLNVSREGN